MAQQVKPASPIRARIQVLALLATELPVNAPGKAAEASPGAWAPATCAGGTGLGTQAPAFHPAQTEKLWQAFGEASKGWELSLSHHLSFPPCSVTLLCK